MNEQINARVVRETFFDEICVLRDKLVDLSHWQDGDFFQKTSKYNNIGIHRITETVSGTGKAKQLLILAVRSLHFPHFFYFCQRSS